MNATIDEQGTLRVEAETPLEAFALEQWCAITESEAEPGQAIPSKMVVVYRLEKPEQ